MNLFETPLYEIPCSPKFVRWHKTHRKKRIREKWKKKYGAIMKCEWPAYKIWNDFYCCKCVMNEIKKKSDVSRKQ